ncbi:MAG TPA: biotin--[acetyl-CoA-carboxylase] ligase [Candidatus Polarisedimenticolia bacterium]|jgi:BirA family biotin operon repressor/biotin-[acetyl-CoA-carboxylase] ligase
MIDRLGADTILAALSAGRTIQSNAPGDEAAGIIGRRIEYHARIGSTNDRARELGASGEPEGTVVVADEQTRGRGRADRAWHSPSGLGLYMSVLLRPEAHAAEAPIFGLMGAVAAATGLAEEAPESIRIKWPNDLIAQIPGDGRRKVAGILSEARTSIDSIRDVVIGFGVNVNHQASDFPHEIASKAVSLSLLTGGPCDRVAVAAAILTAFDTWYTLWRRSGDPPVLQAYRNLALDLTGRRVRVAGAPRRPGDGLAWTGTTDGLTPAGALRVIPEAGGEVVEVLYGEVSRVEEA